ncbi:penicillin-binding protein 1A [Microbulbifer halophilus]|uniref:Penicillin-binding protein 1A n=1 Tax=Microbulbifer halophilus TaxID=453963 RepID=A0ABW5ECH7_9GAMM|nr:penicillin-binding protein 1A [Microbulbifer halophilus]MCW8126680.1 penicillin-binding protein 1A [Microbulbifer halophilus]
MTDTTRNRLLTLFWLILAGAAAAAMAFSSIFLYLKPGLPSVESLRDIRLQTPLRVYSRDMQLIGEFGEKRRNPITMDETPEMFVKAVLAAEDAGFYSHNGVSIKGLMRAASQILQTGSIQSGGSTLTMQVARNFFLSREQRFLRKFNEILLSLQIERDLNKDDILELYINKIFLGNRAYGFQAAAHVYYGRDISELNLAQWAMMAGLPKAPSTFNPIANPTRALVRRNWILKRMLDLGYIGQDDYKNSITAPVTARYHGRDLDMNAPYIAEMARKEAVDLFGDAAYTDGYQVITSVDSKLQRAAREALQNGLETYDSRHGYRGPEQRLDPEMLEDSDHLVDLLNEIPVLGGLEPAVVTAVKPGRLQVQLRDRRVVEVLWEHGLDKLRPYMSENARGARLESAEEMFAPGDVIRLRRIEVKPDGAENVEIAEAADPEATGGQIQSADPFADPGEQDTPEIEPQVREEWHLAQVPKAQGALVSLNPDDGAIRALVGGYDFRQSHFNRVTQAGRQPGSNFKPFIYAAAIEKGYTAASIINDAPIIFEETNLQDVWRPENSSGKFLGPTRLRKGLYKSRNLVSIRLLQALGIDNALDYVENFGFERSKLVRNLTIALGSSALTPLEVARGYAAFANGGFRVEPYLVERVLDVNGETIYRALPLTVCRDCTEPGRESDRDGEPLREPMSLADARIEADAANRTEEPIELRTLPVNPVGDEQARPRAPRAMSAETSYIMDSILKDVIKKGTGRKALAMKRGDIAGKTGTTNGPRDAWFSGYSPHLATSTWVGFDSNAKLGVREYGGSAALPIWIDFMSTALEGLPERHLPQPDGIVTVRINPRTGLRTSSGGMFEIFREDHLPGRESYSSYRNRDTGEGDEEESDESLPEELF